MEDSNNKPQNLDKNLDKFLNTENKEPNVECGSNQSVVKGDKSLVERINKKIITEDGRQLLF